MRTRGKSSNNRYQDKGFTLVELLIVIVILGILATVTVFAVRGITGKGQENAEATDLRAMETAAEAYYLQNGDNPPDEATLGDPVLGLMKGESSLHDYILNGDGTYTITNVRTGLDVGSGAAANGGGGVVPPAANAAQGTPVVWAGIAALEYGDPGGSPVIVIGGAVAGAQWDAAVTSAAPVAAGRRMIFIDVDNLTGQVLADSVHAVNLPHPRRTSVADDVANFDGGTSLLNYLDAINVYAKINDGSGNDVEWLMLTGSP